MGVQEKGTGLKPESGKLRQPGVGETPPWTSNLLFPSLLQRDWMTKKKKKILFDLLAQRTREQL